MADSPFIFEANIESFHKLVVEKSFEVPVLVDFWADWCQPCQMLMPVLNKLADEYQGGFVLVKVNSDENQELSAQFGVRSLPTVKVFKQGDAVDEFMGVQPESAIRDIINKHRTRPTEGLRQQALQYAQMGEMDQAITALTQVISQEPDFYDAMIELTALHLGQNAIDEANDVFQKIPEDSVDSEKYAALQTQIRRIQMQQEAGDISALEQALQDNPDDLQTMLDLAKSKIALDDTEAGMDLYLKVMQKDRSFADDAGRKGLLEAFEILGSGHAAVKKYRSKMFSLLH